MTLKPVSPSTQYRGKLKGQAIRSEEAISRILRRLARAGNLVTLELPNKSRPFSSFVIASNAKKHVLTLDQINSQSAHKEFLAHKQCVITCKLGGCSIEFAVRLVEFETLGGHGQYRVELASAIHSLQRRDSYRTLVFGDFSPNVFLQDARFGEYQGYLIDISMEGIGVRSERHQDWPFVRGEEISRCHIRHSIVDVTTTLEIRHLQRLSSLQCYKMGARFLNLTSSQKKIIREAVMSLQLKQLHT